MMLSVCISMSYLKNTITAGLEPHNVQYSMNLKVHCSSVTLGGSGTAWWCIRV